MTTHTRAELTDLIEAVKTQLRLIEPAIYRHSQAGSDGTTWQPDDQTDALVDRLHRLMLIVGRGLHPAPHSLNEPNVRLWAGGTRTVYLPGELDAYAPLVDEWVDAARALIAAVEAVEVG